MLKDIARRENLSRTTLGHIKHFLSGAFRYARRQGVLENANPMHDVEIPKRGQLEKPTHTRSKKKPKCWPFFQSQPRR